MICNQNNSWRESSKTEQDTLTWSKGPGVLYLILSTDSMGLKVKQTQV